MELALINVANPVVPHNFILDDPRAAYAIREDVEAGETAVIHFTPAERGSFACDKKLPVPAQPTGEGNGGLP